jgi:HSP20 family protein
MTKPSKLVKRESLPSRFDDMFGDFRTEMERMMRPWPLMWRFPHLEEEMRIPLCDMADKGDKYELQVEVPGIAKDKIDIHATEDAVEISGEHAEKVDEKKKDYVYHERSSRSFYRKIPVPEEVDPAKVTAKMNNGILVVDLPKKSPSKKKGSKVQVQ